MLEICFQEWDPTNELIDKAGHYANCKEVGRNRDFTIEEGAISVVTDFTDGSRADTDAVHGYITDIIDRWMRNAKYDDYVSL